MEIQKWKQARSDVVYLDLRYAGEVDLVLVRVPPKDPEDGDPIIKIDRVGNIYIRKSYALHDVVDLEVYKTHKPTKENNEWVMVGTLMDEEEEDAD
jgi:hypothetical protein